MSNKETKPEISIESIKDIVKRYKKQGFQGLSHHDLAIAITTIGFKEVCKQFGGQWNEKIEKEAIGKLKNSQYEIQWYGRINNQNYLPFLQLCIRGDIEKVKQFLFTFGKANRGELVATTDNFKRTALHLAVKEGFDVLAQYLIKEGFSVNARDRQLKTPLHYCKNQLICQLLIKKGANVLAKDNKMCTAAHVAASGSDYKVLELLLKKANVVNQIDSTQKTPLFYAIYNASEDQINVLRILFQNGAKVNEKDMYGKTALHYAAEMGKLRCIPILLQKGASIDIMDNHNKTAIDLSANEKVKKIITAYWQSKGHIFEQQETQKRSQFSKIASGTKAKENNGSKIGSKQDATSVKNSVGQIYTKQVNQVSTWVREKFFVLMKKLQQSGIKSMWHLKRPYIYTGSWAEDVQSLQDLFESFLSINGPEAAMRTFNILCPYQKALPNVLGRSEEAFQSFFGQNWFSNDPVEKIRNMHSQTKIRSELQLKIKQAEDLKSQLLGYRAQIQKLEGTIIGLKNQMNHYQKIEDDLRKERTKNTQQYTEILKHMGQISTLKEEINKLSNGEERTEILNKMVEELRSKNEDLQREIEKIKTNEAAARRKCGKLFLQSLSLAKSGQTITTGDQQANLYDDDAIINLYDLLKNNPPNLQKRFKLVDKRGQGKLNIQEFTKLLEQLSMLPQDVMSLHRITGFAFGKKTLSLQQFKTILENRQRNRPMWQKQLIRKIKSIILSQNIDLQKLFQLLDVDNSGTIQATQLRKGLQNFNIFMNQSDWSNLFNLLDSDKSGTIELEQMKNLFQLETTGKLDQIGSQIKESKIEEEDAEKEQEKNNQEEEENNQEQNQQNNQQNHSQNKEQDHENESNKEENNEQQNQPEQQKSENKLLSDQQEQKSYQQQDSDAEKGIQKLNGQIKIQIPELSLSEDAPTKVFLHFVINEQSTIKMANLELPKLSIAIKFSMIEYKIMSQKEIKLAITAYKTRQFDQDNYLGDVVIGLQNIFGNPGDWQINDSYPFTANEYEKEGIEGSIVVQVKWIPKEQ